MTDGATATPPQREDEAVRELDRSPGPDPTLLEIARGGSRWAWFGVAVIALGALTAVLSLTVLRPGKPKGGAANVQVEGNPGFRMDYARGELKVVSESPQRVELTDRKAEEQGSRLIVTPLTLAPYEGSPTGALPMVSQEVKDTVAERFDDGSVRWADEGLVNVGPNPGYQLSYVAKRDGGTWYGRVAVVVPDVDGERQALVMDGEEQRVSGGKISGPRAVGRQGDLRRPMRSLVFLD
ncbi:MAG: hypothetical protein Q7T55_23860 [Solirubrobacteraceae bacterium]|nr:hypothetical protein [Solirubrobacteraceae bacterium]